MKRREFIALMGGAAAAPLAPPRVSRAQQAMPVVGWLHPGSLQGYANVTVAFRQGLAEAGFVPGRNMSIEYRWADGQYDRLATLAAELVARQPNVIYCAGALAIRAARRASATIPIVFTSPDDPSADGTVKSLNRPEGNMTGASFFSAKLGPKRLELLRELVPKAATIAALRNPKNPRPETTTEWTELQAAAVTLKVLLRVLEAGSRAEIDQAFATLGRQPADALIVLPDLFLTSSRERIITLAAQHRLPAMYSVESFARSGGLLSYGANQGTAYRQAGIYVGRLLKGEQPADLPVLLPSKYELVLNLKAAKAIGLIVPETFLLFRADEVIE
jgi:putative ABC transport system substrate-binding protein